MCLSRPLDPLALSYPCVVRAQPGRSRRLKRKQHVEAHTPPPPAGNSLITTNKLIIADLSQSGFPPRKPLSSLSSRMASVAARGGRGHPPEETSLNVHLFSCRQQGGWGFSRPLAFLPSCCRGERRVAENSREQLPAPRLNETQTFTVTLDDIWYL